MSAIVQHRLPPGIRLVEDKLGEVFGVSRTRIREALRLLAAEKVVTLYPNRSATVSQPTVDEAMEVFEARRIIESAVVTRLAGHASKFQIARLRKHIAEEAIADAAHDRSSSILLTGNFHLLIAKMAENSVLADMMRELVSRTSLIIALYESDHAPHCHPRDHADLLDAIERGQVAKAVKVTVDHLDHIKASLVLNSPEKEAVDFKSVFEALK